MITTAQETATLATGNEMPSLGLGTWQLAGEAATFSGELLSHYQACYHSLDMARQLGILPPVGSAPDRAMAALQHLQARFQRRKGQGPRSG